MVTSWKKGKKSNCRDRKQRSQEQWSVRLFIVDDEWKFDLDNKIKKKKTLSSSWRDELGMLTYPNHRRRGVITLVRARILFFVSISIQKLCPIHKMPVIILKSVMGQIEKLTIHIHLLQSLDCIAPLNLDSAVFPYFAPPSRAFLTSRDK